MTTRLRLSGLLATGALLIAGILAGAAARANEAAALLLDPTAVAGSVCRSGIGAGSNFGRWMQVAAMTSADMSKADTAPPLWDNLGSLSWPVTTSVSLAQAYFDQGFRLSYAFNHAEALRAFRHAQRLDSQCAMCFWGEALVLGPNINMPMDEAANEPAVAAIEKAQELARAGRITERERSMIAALAKRYSRDPETDRAVLDAAYAAAMATVAARFPQDDEVAVLYAEAMMDTQPWDYWEDDRKTPKGYTAEIVRQLERVLGRNSDHPGAIHLYIHAVEASTTPERAEPYADRLGALMPGAGHMVHMPSHIYFRIGRYLDSLEANRKAVAADAAYLEQVEATGIYPGGYVPHNIDFLAASARMAGDAETAIAAAEKLQKTVTDEAARQFPWVQAIRLAPYFTHAQFSEPKVILALPDPGDAFPYVKGAWHYARAIAHIAAGSPEAAMAEKEAIARIGETADLADLMAGGVPATDVLTIAQLVIDGRIHRSKGDLDAAILAFEHAVAVQDGLPYMEPPFWYYPVRQSLGAALLAAGRAAEAEQAFLRSLIDVPNNGWALFGLMQAQKAQGDAAAAATRKILDRTWAGDLQRLQLTHL